MRTGLFIGSCFLDWRPAGAGRAGEGLRDGHPLLRGWAVDGEGEVVAVPALGDEQAEVQGCSAYPVLRVGRAPGPRGAVRGGELDPDRDGGHDLAAGGVAEGARADADVRDVPQP